jgi:3-methyladenine DNA glycosylase AlkD
MARPSGTFDAARYFRGSVDLGFYNVGTPALRALARSIYATQRHDWSVDDAIDFAEILIRDRYLEAKLVGIEVVACYRRDFTPRLLMVWKRWLARGYSANWATTDTICGILIGPLLAAHPGLAEQMRAWARARSLWVRRAAAVSLTAFARKGKSLDLAYDIARALHPDKEDLIHKGVGWLLREAGKTDAQRLERYLRQHGTAIPRTTLRYAIERMPPAKRQEILRVTKTRK